jgi:hypothetical protein
VEPFPGLTGAKSSKEERRLPSRSHRSAYRQGAIHYESHPAPLPITRRAVSMVRVQRSMVRLTIGPEGPIASPPHPHPVRHAARVRGQIASFRGRRSLVTKWLAPARTHQGRTHPELTLEHTEISHISVQAQRTIHYHATKVWIVCVWD